MARSGGVNVACAVEGLIDEAVVVRVLEHVGAVPGAIYGKQGKAHLRKRIRGYNEAAKFGPWVVLVDLDHDAECAPELQKSWLSTVSPNLCFRVSVRAVEAWLLADRERLARFLRISAMRIPGEPESVDDPKSRIVALARLSSRRDMREDMVPRPSSGRTVGAGYTARLIEFVTGVGGWRPDIAAERSPSLDRCLRCLRRFVEGR